MIDMAQLPTAPPPIAALREAGVSVWLDDLSRERLRSGNLQELIDTSGIVGVTTNPSIFQAALADGDAYTEQLTQLAGEGKGVDEVVFALTTDDVREACDLFAPIYEATDGVDGRVSIEVDPRLAQDADQTAVVAKQLSETVDRPQVYIKIPATQAGLPAITATLAEGISVNVTLIFSLERYRAVMNAFVEGIEQALAAGKDISTIHSVASFFVSRVDSEVDGRLGEIGTEAAKALRGKAGLANARLAYQAYEEVFATPRWQRLETEGGRRQRPLWASTGVKDPAYPDTLYVTELAVDNTVNTMPEKTLDATIDHGEITGDAVTGTYVESQQVLDALEGLGISYTEVTAKLEKEGVEKFEKAWAELLGGVEAELSKAASK
ncbi:transaldolase [Janibacter sp. Soil728]|uniref:transaldolase n=1 Tax=Janibacter sp. Soil728 TaxID=1736393 RepID=UPI0006F3D2C3|nr:transaldolase [Janibacter sp. Soil728]KRE37125.1 transaldolase [Janibacter sp. Soil728]